MTDVLVTHYWWLHSDPSRWLSIALSWWDSH